MHYVPLEEIGIMRNLRVLGLSAVKNYGAVNRGQFSEFAPSLEELNLVDSDVKSLDRGAFAHVPSVSALVYEIRPTSRPKHKCFYFVAAKPSGPRTEGVVVVVVGGGAVCLSITQLPTALWLHIIINSLWGGILNSINFSLTMVLRILFGVGSIIQLFR